MPRGFGVQPTGVIVRDYLLSEGEATITQCRKEVIRIAKEHKWQYPRAENFRKYFWLLRKAGLVEETRREAITEYERSGEMGVSRWPRSSDFHKERIYYRIVQGKESSIAWNNVQRALYG